MKRLLIIVATAIAVSFTLGAKPKKLTSTLKWDATPEGVLQITGTGDMPDWPAPQGEAWYKDGKWHKINRIEIGEGVTSIGFKSFSPVGSEFQRAQPVELVLPSTLVAMDEVWGKKPLLKGLEIHEGRKRLGLGL